MQPRRIEGAAMIEACEHPAWIAADGRVFHVLADLPEETPCRLIERVGKRTAGRRLDGVEHDAMPEPR